MIISPQSLDTNLSQLLAEVKSGSMQLPEFQRDWTWDDNRIRGIIASLSQGYPMGAIMRLQYGNPDIQFKYRTITGVKGVSVKPEHLILDGQQRLTSIYQATSSKEPVSPKQKKARLLSVITISQWRSASTMMRIVLMLSSPSPKTARLKRTLTGM